jgi:hypothetical protein
MSDNRGKNMKNEECCSHLSTYKIYKPMSSIAMGSLLSSTMAEIFPQDVEQNRIKHLLEAAKII